MKRKLITCLMTLLLLVVFASPVLADDGVDVGVVVVTPGDVDLDVGIVADGDVNITIDGVDFKETASLANAAWNGVSGGVMGTDDWWRYYRLYLLPTFKAQDAETEILTSAMLRLIIDKETSGIALQSVIAENKNLQILLLDATQSSEDADHKIWNQLMTGAERHIHLLTNEVSDYASSNDLQVEDLKAQVKSQEYQIYVLKHQSGIMWRYGSIVSVVFAGLLITMAIAFCLVVRKRNV